MQTLQELSESFRLYAVCEPCERMEQLNLEQLIARFGGEYLINNIRLRLHCQQCQQRSQSLRIVYVGPNERAAKFRYSR